MKFFMFLVTALLSVCAANQIDQYHDRHDATVYFVAHNSPYPLVDFDASTNTDIAHRGAFVAGSHLTYKVDRTLALPGAVLATATRRIVRRFTYNIGTDSNPILKPGREPVFNYPSQPGVEITPGDSISFSHFDLPSAKDAPSPMNPVPKDIPPGEYSLETAISFPYHGDQRTYTAETNLFRVEAR